MSVAASFAALDVFPLCLKTSAAIDAAFPGSFRWARNLTLAQVMSFYWNLETFALTTSASASGTFPGGGGGTAYSITANGTLTFSPLGATGDWTEDTFFGNFSVTGVTGWVRADSDGSIPLGRTSTKPRDRVCSVDYSITVGPQAAYFIGEDSRGGTYASCDFQFIIATDSVNSGKYAVGYSFHAKFVSTPITPTFFYISYRHAGSGSPPSSVFNTGSFTIGGVSFDYWCETDLPPTSTGFTTSGGTMVATSSDYTY